MGEITVTSSTQHKTKSEIHKHKLTTTTTTTTTTMKSSIAAILALGLCLAQGTLTKACWGANFLRDVGADAAALFGNHDLSDQISGSFSDNDRRKLFGIGDAAPIAIHLPLHKPDDFLGEFQTAAGEIVPHPEANAAPTDTDYLDSVIEEETNGDFNSGQRKLLAGITQLFNHAVRRFGEKAVENGVPAGVRVGANLAHIPTVPADNRKLLGIGDAAPIAIHLPFHKPDDFLGEFQTAAGEIVPHFEANAAPTDTDYLDSVIEEETNGDFNSGQRKLLAGITQLFNHAVRRFGEKAVENGVPAGVRVGANLAHIPTT